MDTVPAATDDGLLAGAAFFGAAAGFLGGLYLGAQMENAWFPCSCDDPGLLGAVLGSFAGPALVTPLLVHGANHGRGSLGRGFAYSAAIAGTGFLGLLATQSPLLFLATPVAQMVSAVLVERGTTRAP